MGSLFAQNIPLSLTCADVIQVYKSWTIELRYTVYCISRNSFNGQHTCRFTLENIPLADFTVPGANVGFHMERWWFGAMPGVQLGLSLLLGFLCWKDAIGKPKDGIWWNARTRLMRTCIFGASLCCFRCWCCMQRLILQLSLEDHVDAFWCRVALKFGNPSSKEKSPGAENCCEAAARPSGPSWENYRGGS